jgi:AcrR family transcriptional regulator
MASNPERSAKTRTALLGVARNLFAAHGFAGAGTEAILQEAGVRRGALYHHFADKAALFEAVCVAMHGEGVTAIEAACAGIADPMTQLERGCRAWMDHMARPDIRRVLGLEAPGVLGWARWNELDQAHGLALLRAGLHALPQKRIDADDLTILLNGAMNAAVLAADPQAQPEEFARMKDSVITLLRAAAG